MGASIEKQTFPKSDKSLFVFTLFSSDRKHYKRVKSSFRWYAVCFTSSGCSIFQVLLNWDSLDCILFSPVFFFSQVRFGNTIRFFNFPHFSDIFKLIVPHFSIAELRWIYISMECACTAMLSFNRRIRRFQRWMKIQCTL